MLQHDKPDDYVIATGQVNSLEDFVIAAFRTAGLEWSQHVDVDTNLYRALVPRAGRANPSKAERVLGWKAATDMRGVIERMVRADMDSTRNFRRPAVSAV